MNQCELDLRSGSHYFCVLFELILNTINNMKKILFYALAMILAVACYDDTALWDELKDHESRITKLETLCNQMNTNISSLQSIVAALQEKDYVTNVAPIKENGKEIGYTITFSKSGSITIYHGTDGKDGVNGQNGKDGADGKDGYIPVLGVKKDADGVYYWTLDGDWLTDASGNKIPTTGKDGADGADGSDGTDGKDGQDGADGKDGADGITPQLKIEESYWCISYDNGQTWERLGKAVGEDGKDGADGADGKDGENGDSFFKSVTQDEENVYITLADGTEFVLPKAKQANVIVELCEVGEDSVIFNVEVLKNTVDLKVTVYYALKETLTLYNYDGKVSITEFPNNTCTLAIRGLEQDNIYYYFTEIISNGSTVYSSVNSFVLGNIYVDEYGINHGLGIEFDGIVWAPVNCGYHETYFKYGKLYQWGRKYGQGYQGPIASDIDGETFSDSFLPQLSQGPVELSVGQSKDNADVFYCTWYPLADWCVSGDVDLWNEGTERNPVKTEYDPCPAGWRVPTSRELEVLSGRYWHWTTEKGQNGQLFSCTSPYVENSPRVFLPAAGFLTYDAGSAEYRGSNGYYWSSEAGEVDNAGGLSFNERGVFQLSYSNRAYGKAVRCVKE